jgi:branched-chain amino acid transport system ATP-binding protein
MSPNRRLPARDRDMLTLDSVTAGYGDTTVLRDVNFTVGDGEVVALLGPNGAGKTTLLRTATGFVKPRSGRIEFDGADVTGQRPHAFVRRGVCHLPEGRGIFPSLTVRENLRIQARSRDANEVAAEVAELFPALGSRFRQTAGSLSGGEQQMLALSRAYLTGP